MVESKVGVLPSNRLFCMHSVWESRQKHYLYKMKNEHTHTHYKQRVEETQNETSSSH